MYRCCSKVGTGVSKLTTRKIAQHRTKAHQACIIKIIPQVSVINFTPFLSGKSIANINIPMMRPTKKVIFAASLVPRFQKYPIIKTAKIEGAMLEPIEFTIVIMEPTLAPATIEKSIEIIITTNADIFPMVTKWLSGV